MNELTAMIAFLTGVGVLGLALLRGLAVRRRQLSSGRTLCTAPLVREGGRLVFQRRVSFSRTGEWCRLLLALQVEHRDAIDRRPFRGKIATVRGPPYRLTITTAFGEEVYREEDMLGRFLGCLGGSGSGSTGLTGERSTYVHRGRVALLEFVARRGGVHDIALEIQAASAAENLWSSSSAEVLEAELTVQEGVELLGRGGRYPHRRVEL